MPSRRIPLRITLAFAVVSGLWIFFSDQILSFLVQDTRIMAELSIVKGWLYVLVVSLLLYFLIRKNVRGMQDAHLEVVRHREQLLITQFTIDKSADLVLWVDPSGRVLYANQAASRILGYPPEVLTTLRVFAFEAGYSEESWPGLWARLRVEKSFRLNSTYRTREGRTFPVEMSADLIDFGGREFACAYVRDISERLEVEAQLRQSQKMESVGTLAAGVAHDFNNILTVIQGCSELSTKVIDEREEVLSLQGQILSAVGRASRLVQSLLAFSRKQELRFRVFRFNDLMESLGGFLDRVLGASVRLEFVPCAEDTTVEADFTQWEQVVMNLAVNARDAMPGGGTLTLRTWVAGDRVFLAVRDTGTGISPEIRERIFEPFFTTKEQEGGTGLGLSTAYGIVKHHRGTFEVFSPPAGGPPVGTEFVVSLPKAPGSETRPGP